MTDITTTIARFFQCLTFPARFRILQPTDTCTPGTVNVATQVLRHTCHVHEHIHAMYMGTSRPMCPLQHGSKSYNRLARRHMRTLVREICIIVHVGGTRCVTWSIDRIIQIHACITWGVELILAIFFIFFFYV